MRKDAQLLGQPLVYLFAIIVGAVILAWGVNTVLKLSDTASQVELGKFASNVESKADQYLNLDEGSSTAIKIAVPAKITYVCFYDSSSPVKKCIIDGKKECIIGEMDEAFAALAATKTKYNMFFLPLGIYKLPPKQLKNLKVDTQTGNPICFTNKQGNEFTLTSMGTYVSVS